MYKFESVAPLHALFSQKMSHYYMNPMNSTADQSQKLISHNKAAVYRVKNIFS